MTDVATETRIHAFIARTIADNPVVVFMKGVPDQPQCGFSAIVVQILDHLGADFVGVDVLQSDELRQGIKGFSDWATIPQLYVNGEFVGGSDIVRQMFEAGELKPFMVEQGVTHALEIGPGKVLAAVEAVLEEGFAMHGVLATTMFVGPVVVVNGAIRRRIGMNAKGNVLGQGNRANGAIGRALQLVIRNIGGGRPQEVDRATLGNPGKYTYCFAEDEEGSCWEPLSVERGMRPGQSAVTVFAGFGLQGMVDQKSREPESLARSFAESLKAIHNVKLAPSCDALLVICPEHERTFRNAGWSKARLYEELYKLCEIPGEELVAGAKGIAEGGPAALVVKTVNKFRSGGLMIVRAGGGAGMFSGIIGGWSQGGPRGSIPITKEVRN